MWTCGRWTWKRGWPVRPTLAHESFITHAGKAARVAKAEQKPAECIRPPLCPPGQILHRLLQRAQKADCILGRGVCLCGGPELDSYAGSGKAKPDLQSVLHMCEPPTFSLRIAQALAHIYSLRNIHRDGRAFLQLCCFLLF